MTDYSVLCSTMKELSQGVSYTVSNLSNAAALLWESLSNINWAGFYILDDGSLKLGPFQGKPACVEIQIGKGVCGTAAKEDRTQLVPDVHKFPGHIACDCASNSEIVVPIHKGDNLFGVLDIDSPFFDRFTDYDKTGLEDFVKTIEEIL